MIDRLTADDCRAAFREIQEPVRIKLTFDEQKVQHLLLTHEEVRSSARGHDEDVQVRELVTHLLSACARLDMIGDDLDCRWGLAIVDRWLERNGYLVLSVPHERVKLFEVLTSLSRPHALASDAGLDSVRAWAERNIAEIAAGTTLAEKSGRAHDRPRLQGFVACPMTGLSADEVEDLRELCDTASSVLGEFGVLTFQPVLYTASGIAPFAADDPLYRSVNERLIAESEIVLVIATQPSSGLGVVASTAQRYRKCLLYATAAPTVTPMITGLDPAPIVLDLRRLEDELRRTVALSMPAIEESAARARQDLSEIAAELRELRSALLNQPIGYPGGLTPARFLELLGSPELFAGATVRERQEIYRLVNV